MKKNWTLGLEEAEATDIESAFKHSSLLRERNIALLKQKITSKQKDGRSDDWYNSPNWTLLQADNNGFIKGLEYAISLIKE